MSMAVVSLLVSIEVFKELLKQELTGLDKCFKLIVATLKSSLELD